MKGIKEKIARRVDKAMTLIKKHKRTSVAVGAAAMLILIIVLSPKTVACGNGYSHQVGDFGKCDLNFDGCTGGATHRLHHFFGNEDYCDACWDIYGENMFLRLSGNDDSGPDYNQNKCRYSGCEKTAKYSDWDRRYCTEHLQGEKYCRHPYCSERIPINGLSDYCWEHKSSD